MLHLSQIHNLQIRCQFHERALFGPAVRRRGTSTTISDAWTTCTKRRASAAPRRGRGPSTDERARGTAGFLRAGRGGRDQGPRLRDVVARRGVARAQALGSQRASVLGASSTRVEASKLVEASTRVPRRASGIKPRRGLDARRGSTSRPARVAGRRGPSELASSNFEQDRSRWSPRR